MAHSGVLSLTADSVLLTALHCVAQPGKLSMTVLQVLRTAAGIQHDAQVKWRSQQLLCKLRCNLSSAGL